MIKWVKIYDLQRTHTFKIDRDGLVKSKNLKEFSVRLFKLFFVVPFPHEDIFRGNSIKLLQ